MFLVFYIFIFLFGLCIGSFLNCVVYRLEKKQSFLKGRSYCPHCRHALSWLDLVPVFSFLLLKGKCRYCKKSISIQYLLIELMTGLLFLLIFNFQFTIFNEFSIFNFQTVVNFLFLLIISCFLIVIFVYDLKHYIIPDKVLFPAIAIVFLEQLIFKFSLARRPMAEGFLDFSHLWAGLGAGAFFLFFFLISSGRWMGFGDVNLAFFMGLFLGYPKILVALFSAFLLGAIIGVGLIIFGSKNLKSEVPFGPFLIIGTFIALFYGQEIIQWNSNVFLF